MIALTQSKNYRSFVKDLNVALEYIYAKRMSQVDAILDDLKTVVLEIATTQLGQLGTHLTLIDQRLEPVFDLAIDRVEGTVKQLRRAVWGLAYLGHSQAIARATAKAIKVNLTRARLDDIESQPLMDGVDLKDRIELSFGKLKRKVLDAVHTAIVQGEDAESLAERIERAFPKYRVVNTRPRKLKVQRKGLKEADPPGVMFGFEPSKKEGLELTTGIIDNEAWQSILGEYMAEYVPSTRGEYKEFTYRGQKKYLWELEQQVTNDFVMQVRAGANEIATENGYTDFVWIAVIDDKTCDTDRCSCVWRDGLTTSEIEKELKGTHKDEDCKAVVPPAHFNCRCDVAPITDALPEKPLKDLGDFETWLTQI